LKVYLNKTPVAGPWGGGNKFVSQLAEELHKKKVNVTYELTSDVDVIFCFDPRSNHQGLWYQDFLNHKIKLGSKIIQRIGDVGTHSKPDLTKLVNQTSRISDFVIFPSEWAKNYINYDNKNCRIIKNRPHPVFYQNRKNKFKVEKKLKIITHHWSTNEKKGFDLYAQLGKYLLHNPLRNIEFTYIGRYNEKFSKEGINVIDPLNSDELSKILPKHDLYLTASIEEAGANHVLEALGAGLPVLYRENGGSIGEYCEGYGIEYKSDLKSMICAIDLFRKNSLYYYEKVADYTGTIDDVVREYVRII